MRPPPSYSGVQVYTVAYIWGNFLLTIPTAWLLIIDTANIYSLHACWKISLTTSAYVCPQYSGPAAHPYTLDDVLHTVSLRIPRSFSVLKQTAFSGFVGGPGAPVYYYKMS